MEDRFNTIAGWTLFAGVVALGFSSVSAKYFEADKHHPPHKMGYEIEGVESEGDAEEGPSFNTLLATADVANGEKLFGKCVSCHTITPGGPNGIGPNLHGVIGEEIGKGVGGFAFSSALSGHGGKWTFDELDAWLKSPKAYAPGTKMSFAGLSKTKDRADLIAYLNTQGSNLPLPKADAAPAEGDAAAAPAEGAEAAADGKPAEGAAPAADAAAPAAGDKAAAPAAAPAH
ncbi:cytochrome c family protein [Caenibius sp. WL]|uniref:c-type cytochrome n=1 Tax=Caenibius sp. WL TaxID=2872646 RepID=UPI001C9941F6|nr:cytochrome c family protein [Caenibius sp. WL]QZP08207.1 cytochrome c family protein [Caenibius sp. WL]